MTDKDLNNVSDLESASEPETSRRRLLVAGAAAVVGASAIGATPEQAEAHNPNPGRGIKEERNQGPQRRIEDMSYYPNQSLADVIEKAWNEEVYYRLLLSFGEGKQPVWPNGNPNYTKTKAALSLKGLKFDRPVVLTQDQYDIGYTKENNNEVVFVIPDKPQEVMDGKASPTGDTIRALMAAVPFGM